MGIELEEVKSGQLQEANERYELLRAYMERGIPLKYLAEQHNVPLRTLQRWLAQYYKFGLQGLIRKQRVDRNTHPRIAPAIQREIEQFALEYPRPSIAHIHRHVALFAKEHALPVPSYRTVGAILRSAEKKARVEADLAQLDEIRFGKAGVGPTKAHIHKRMTGNQVQRSNQVWLTDYIQLDIWVRTFRAEKIRPLLAVVIDAYSRAVTGFYVGTQIDPAGVMGLALHRALMPKDDQQWITCGVPECLMVDAAMYPRMQDLETLSQRFGIAIIERKPLAPSSKGLVERRLEVVNQSLANFPGYAQRKPDAEATDVSIQEIQRVVHTAIMAMYNQRPLRPGGQSPFEQWAAHNFVPHLPSSIEQLDPLLLPVPKPRFVRAHGIHFLNLIYYHPVLTAYIDQRVSIRYDPSNISHVSVYQGNVLLCRAQSLELRGQQLSIYELDAFRKQHKRSVEEGILPGEKSSQEEP